MTVTSFFLFNFNLDVFYHFKLYHYFVFVSILYNNCFSPDSDKSFIIKFHFNLYAFISFQVV